MSVIDTLVTDRTQEDVSSVKQLISKYITNSLSEAEKLEWNKHSAKGSYNYTDLNRVQEAVTYLVEVFATLGYTVQQKVPRVAQWKETDIPRLEDMSVYLFNVKSLRDTISVFTTTPEVPISMTKLFYVDANSIEQILVDLQHLITLMEQSWFYSGEIYSGEVI